MGLLGPGKVCRLFDARLQNASVYQNSPALAPASEFGDCAILNFTKSIVHFAEVREWPLGGTDRVWDVEDLVALWEAYEQRRPERAA